MGRRWRNKVEPLCRRGGLSGATGRDCDARDCDAKVAKKPPGKAASAMIGCPTMNAEWWMHPYYKGCLFRAEAACRVFTAGLR